MIIQSHDLILTTTLMRVGHYLLINSFQNYMLGTSYRINAETWYKACMAPTFSQNIV